MIRLADAPAREVGACSGRLPIVVFTDRACEDEGKTVTHGATLFDPESGKCLMFGDKVPETCLQKWRRDGKTQLICQAEIFPFFLTRAMLSVLPFGKHDSGTQAKYPGSKGLLIDPIYFDPAKMEKFV